MKCISLLAALMLLANPASAEPEGGQAALASLLKAQSAELEQAVEKKLEVLMRRSLQTSSARTIRSPRPFVTELPPAARQSLQLAWLPTH